MCAAARHALHPQRRGTLAPPYRRFTNSVGDDAHIVPADETILTKIFGEFEIAQWVDVGIDPYEYPRRVEEWGDPWA